MIVDELLAISALQHIAYCPRQFALIHVERVWLENRFTAEGRVLHNRVDSGEAEQRSRIRYERGIGLLSRCHGLAGKMDLLEIEQGDPPIYRPVEYKRGKPKTEDWDRIQLCAQVLCLEEMKSVTVDEGAIWYWEVRKRQQVVINAELREKTVASIAQAKALLERGVTPAPTNDKKRCRACSLLDACQPRRFRVDRSVDYVQKLFET